MGRSNRQANKMLFIGVTLKEMVTQGIWDCTYPLAAIFVDRTVRGIRRIAGGGTRATRRLDHCESQVSVQKEDANLGHCRLFRRVLVAQAGLTAGHRDFLSRDEDAFDVSLHIEGIPGG